jgi:hypothetical protein
MDHGIEWLDEYEDFKRGDVVKVEGIRGDWEWIKAHVVHGVVESYTVLKAGEGMRFFVPSRVTHKKRKK